MNKGNLIFAIIAGLWMGHAAYMAIAPKRETLSFSPNLKGEYVDPLEEDTYRAEIKQWSNGNLTVSFEPYKRWPHYLLPLVVAIVVGVLWYRNLQEQAKREEESKEREQSGFRPETNYISNKDTLYEEFLQGNSNRRFVPRSTLEEEFQAWKSKRDSAGESTV